MRASSDLKCVWEAWCSQNVCFRLASTVSFVPSPMERAESLVGGPSLEHEAVKDDGLKEHDTSLAQPTSHKRQHELTQSEADPKPEPEPCETTPKRTRRCVRPAPGPDIEGLDTLSTPMIGRSTSCLSGEDDGRDSEKTLILGQTGSSP